MAHEIYATDVNIAVAEIVNKDHILASAEAREGGVKRLSYNPATGVYRIKTKTTERTCKLATEAATYYSEK